MIPSSDPIDLDDYARTSMSQHPVRVLRNIEAGFIKSFQGVSHAATGLGLTPKNENLDSIMNVLDQDNEDGFFSINGISNMIGYTLNPISLLAGSALGAASGAALKGITNGIMSGASRVLPATIAAGEAISSKPLQSLVEYELPQFLANKSIRNLGKAGAVNSGAFIGFALPEELAKEYDQDTGHIHWGGIATGAAIAGGTGLLLGSLPFGAGLLWGKIRGIAKEEPGITPHAGDVTPENLSEIQSALAEGRITEKEAKLFEDYLQNPNDKNLHGRFNEFLTENGHAVNTVNNNIDIPLLAENDIHNLQVAMMNELVTDLPVPMKTALTETMISNKLNEWRSNPNMQAGIRGSIDFINRKLDKMPEQLVKINKIARTYLKENILKKHPFSQDNLYKLVKSRGFDTKRTVYTIPKEVERRIRQEKQIRQFENEIKQFEKLYDKTGQRKYLAKIERSKKLRQEKELSLEKILSPKEEIAKIESTLIKDGKLIDKLEHSNAYNRLLDLSRMSPKARGLLYKVNLIREYERQEAYRNLLNLIDKIIDSDMKQVTSPEAIQRFMQERLARNSSKTELPEIQDTIKRANRVDSDIEQTIKDAQAEVDRVEAKNLKEEFGQYANKIKQFKDSENIFKTLIACTLGALNG